MSICLFEEQPVKKPTNDQKKIPVKKSKGEEA